MHMPVDHLPSWARPTAMRIRGFLLTDGALLVMLAVEALIRGVSYLIWTPPGHPVERFFPLTVWAVIWIVIGVLCLATARWHDGPAAATAVGLAVGINLLWALSLFTESTTSHGGLGNTWGGGAAYLLVALGTLWTVWRTSRANLIVKEAASD